MEKYKSILTVEETQAAIQFLRNKFETELCDALNLNRASAPMFVNVNSGLNDNLNGVERPVTFDVLETGETMEIVHSLAKWKRYALHEYGIEEHRGIYTDMNAIRRDETCDAIHSLYVDQWDWEIVINREDRTEEYLKKIVREIYRAIKLTSKAVQRRYPELTDILPDDITFVTTQELEDRWPDYTDKQKERAIAKECGAVFIMKIGGKLKSGKKHDGRAPDYDDWELNGDILVYYPQLDIGMELSSMGIRVDEESMMRQLKEADALDRLKFDFHQNIINGKLPLSIGGGVGQSRLCMFLLKKAHIGEVQSSVWPQSEIDYCRQQGINLL
ncbi:MAG: aspartate--ammonia ligase [Oscillospiraceae bacterium]|nr:aspartate--ammonia ligase [Oscillospiraceae bacterium]